MIQIFAILVILFLNFKQSHSFSVKKKGSITLLTKMNDICFVQNKKSTGMSKFSGFDFVSSKIKNECKTLIVSSINITYHQEGLNNIEKLIMFDSYASEKSLSDTNMNYLSLLQRSYLDENAFASSKECKTKRNIDTVVNCSPESSTKYALNNCSINRVLIDYKTNYSIDNELIFYFNNSICDNIHVKLKNNVLMIYGYGAIEEKHLKKYNNQTFDKIVINEGVSSIYKYSFSYIHAKEILLPNTLKKINMFSFAFNDVLESITIPPSIEYFEYSSIAQCPSLKTIKVLTNKFVGSDIKDDIEFYIKIYNLKSLKDVYICGNKTHYFDGKTEKISKDICPENYDVYLPIECEIDWIRFTIGLVITFLVIGCILIFFYLIPYCMKKHEVTKTKKKIIYFIIYNLLTIALFFGPFITLGIVSSDISRNKTQSVYDIYDLLEAIFQIGTIGIS